MPFIRWILITWARIQYWSDQIIPTRVEVIAGLAMVAMSITGVVFFPPGAVTDFAKGNPGSLHISLALVVSFGVCGLTLLIIGHASDRVLKGLMLPMIALWALVGLSLLARLRTQPQTIAGLATVFIMFSAALLFARALIMHPERERP